MAYTDWSIGDFIRRARAEAVFRQHGVRDHRRPLRLQRRQDQPADQPLSHPAVDLFAGELQPQRVDRLMGQLDIPPTLLGMLNFSYRTRFFGHDLFQLPPGREHAFPGTYEKLGYLQNDVAQHPGTAAQAGAGQARLRNR